MEDIKANLQKICHKLFNLDIEPELTRTEEQFGDYSTNVALQLAKSQNKNPREVAEQIVADLKGPDIKNAEVAGPGFINLTLTDEALWKLSQAEPKKSLNGKTVVAEYSDPNPFKVLHAGHLYTTLVGDAVAKLLESAGAKIHRVNFGGDVGLHVARAMWAIVKTLGGENPDKLNEIKSEDRLKWISDRYVEGNEAYEDDETKRPEIIEINKKIYKIHEQDDHNSPLAQIYWTCRQWSYEGFDDLYQKLRVHKFDKYYPESETTPKGIELVNRGLKEGLFEKSDGAVVLNGEYHGLHTRVFMNSAGLPTYEAKDLGLAAEKWEAYHPDVNIIITGNDIVDYMSVVLMAVKHFHPEMAVATKHLTHGMIKLAGGAKMSSRKGNVLLADDILEAANQANKELSGQDNPDTVLAAVKYAFLKNRIGSDIIYDPKDSVALEGQSGPYLQYAHARARSILSKAQNWKMEDGRWKMEADERSLVRKISEYSEVVDKAINDLLPSHVCTYLYELAQVFNRFYEKNRVIDDPRQDLRLSLVKTYADTLKKGLELLNIPAPEKM